MLDHILDFIFPPICLACGRPGSYLCKKCHACELTPYYVQTCHVCREECRMGLVHKDCAQFSWLDGVVVGYVYSDTVERILATAKYKFYFKILDLVGKEMAVGYRLSVLGQRQVNVTCVPLSKYKQKWRGFNQAEILARHVAKACGLEFNPILHRSRHTKSQVGKSRQGRLGALRDVLQLTREILPAEKEWLVIDDVMTTGTTLEACAKVLKEGGAKHVYGLVFARGSR